METRLNPDSNGLRISPDADELADDIEVTESWRKPISVAKVKTVADFLEFEKKIAALGHTSALAPGADSREVIYENRA